MQALMRGLRQRCPNCVGAPLYASYLKPVPACGACGTALGHIRADDFPPYLTMVVVGHIVVPLIVLTEQHIGPPGWVHAALWLPLTVILMLFFLPRLKGAIVAFMWTLGLKGDETQGVKAEAGE